jgi:hypothetical protein
VLKNTAICAFLPTLPPPSIVPLHSRLLRHISPATSAFTHRTCTIVAASDGAINRAWCCLSLLSLQLAGTSKAAAVTAGEPPLMRIHAPGVIRHHHHCVCTFSRALTTRKYFTRAQSRLRLRPCCCCQWLLPWRSFLMCVSPFHLRSASPHTPACAPYERHYGVFTLRRRLAGFWYRFPLRFV